MISSRLLVFFLVLFLSGAGVAQSSSKLYRDLEDALMHKDSVYRLDLSGKRLRQFPEEIFELKALQELDLSRCKLDSMPTDWPLSELTSLVLSNNRIKEIPIGIFRLRKLEKLRLDQNQLEYLPKTVLRLENLKVLDLWGNNLRRLPNGMNALTQLNFVDLRVMEISTMEQERISEMLPESKIFFTSPCNCMDDDSLEAEPAIDR